MRPYGIVYAGVGGQGVLTASSIVGEAAIRRGLNVVMSEIHGMAQRGGSVVAEMRIGNARSSIVPEGEADVILGFEPVEAYRVAHKGGENTTVIMSTDPIIPFTVSVGKETYPPVEELIGALQEKFRVVTLSAVGLARRAGNLLTANVVMVGALTALPGFPIDREEMMEAVKVRVPPRFVEVNLKAFELGYEEVSRCL